MEFAIKSEVVDGDSDFFYFPAQKTMYGGKLIRQGKRIFLFSSENEGERGLFGQGIVTLVEHLEKRPEVKRQTPRVTIAVTCLARTNKSLGRKELRLFFDWNDGRSETELNFKFYRQATNKIVGITEATARFLDTFFEK